MLVSEAHSTPSLCIAGSQWQDEHDLQQRPLTMGSGNHLDLSFHQRSRSGAHTQSPNRLSVLGGRSRSNTATSTASSRQSPTSSMASTETSQSSHEDQTYSAIGSNGADRQERRTKSLLLRSSRILRRQGSKFGLSAALSEEDEAGKKIKQKFDVVDFFHRSHRISQKEAHERMKSLISEPFDFHHLTHTSAAHFQTLDNASKDDLVTELSAIQASQKPRTELKGIQAEDLHFRNFSSENLTSGVLVGGEATSANSNHSTPPISPTKSQNQNNSQAVENFSRPVSRSRHTSVSPSIIPPQRVSSRQAVSEIPETTSQMMDEILGLNSPQTLPEFVYSTPDDFLSRPSSLYQIDLSGVFHSAVGHGSHPDVGHAVTTDGIDSPTSTTVINSYLSDLEDVPEEDEMASWSDDSVLSPASSASRSPNFDHSVPAAFTSNSSAQEPPEASLGKEKHFSFSDALISPTLPRFHAAPDESPNSQTESQFDRTSVCKWSIEDFPRSWDEDIDYCYEHAAESDCNFNWHHSCVNITEGVVSETSPSMCNDLNQPAPVDIALHQPRRLHPLETSHSDPTTPDLDPGSALTTSTGILDVVTPVVIGSGVELITTQQDKQGDYFKPPSPPIIPIQSIWGKDAVSDAVYDEMFATGEDPYHHLPFYPSERSRSMDFPASPRSSYCNSQESIILSRAASIVRKHRSSASSTSVPELIPSPNSSRDNMTREGFRPAESATHELSPIFIANRRGSSCHRQTRSLISELYPLSKPRMTPGDGSTNGLDGLSLVTPPTHDRARSASALQTDSSIVVAKANGPLFAVRMQSPPMVKGRRRRSRASYSLFPTPAAITTQRS